MTMETLNDALRSNLISFEEYLKMAALLGYQYVRIGETR